jgi:hypothetical protein
MNKAALAIDQLFHSSPEAREWLGPYMKRIETYSHECGCSMGASFLVAALGLVLVHCFLAKDSCRTNMFTDALRGIVFVFFASVAGKLLGILLARVRLALLYRYLITEFRIEGV